MSFVRVHCEDKRHFIKIEDVENVNFGSLVKIVVKSFDLQDVHGAVFHVSDSLDTCIDTDEILKHVLNTRNNGDFFLKIGFKRRVTDVNRSILSTDIESYVDDHGGKEIISAFKNDDRLTENLRRKLVNIVLDFIIERFGLYPTKEEKVAVAMATVNFFTCFKLAESRVGGIELFYNPVGGLGWITSGLKTRRARANGQDNGENLDQNINRDSPLDPKAEIEYLRSAVVNEVTLPTIKEKLTQTLEYRRLLFRDQNLNLLQEFPYFFHHPELILHDFQNLFECSNIADFVSDWPLYKENVKTALIQHVADTDFATVFSPDIEDILMLLKLLPNKPRGRATSNNRLNFLESIDRLIVFGKRGTPPWNYLKKEQTQPYIIAFGPTPKIIQQYFIVVEKQLINVPTHFSFIETFDLLFKLHHVLNFDFDVNLKNMMNFVEFYMYKISRPSFKPTVQMIKVFKDLMN
ncbi:uncharacterized protein LOC129571654 [Sitodiplosis mosellana]|uniref:uncharacterized protein LOC129571654 n=1 Tax=Sitodiplosis mosellana TaxID=263140 RepID=UPI002444FDF3|nr:uncharacterized protein LOC129571654 [Sitodiplosis mosellana]